MTLPVKYCTRPGCKGRMLVDRLNTDEWNCISCGAVQYENHTPARREDEESSRTGHKYSERV